MDIIFHIVRLSRTSNRGLPGNAAFTNKGWNQSASNQATNLFFDHQRFIAAEWNANS